MSREVELTLPVCREDLSTLQLGDRVYLTGTIVSSAGLPAYERLLKELKENIPPPVPLEEGVIFHLGAALEQRSDGRWHLHYINPTTSTRFDKLMPRLIEAYNLLLVGGKGGLSSESAAALSLSGGIYLSFPGGGAPILTDAVEEVVDVFWPEMVSHYRIVTTRVKRMGPLVVGIDSRGESLFSRLDDHAKQRREAILASLEHERATGEIQERRND